jgi:DNA-binding GntR family transcriptional regulator
MELERFGLVIIEPNKGAMVRDFTLNEIEQIIQMQKLLEEQAARSMSLPVTAEFLSDLMELQKQHEAAVTKEDMRNAFKLNKKFHDALYNLCENPYVVDLVKYFTTLLDVINSRMLFFGLIKNSPKTHLKIISALENEDRDELVYLLSVVKIKSADIYYHEMRKWWANEEEQPSF